MTLYQKVITTILQVGCNNHSCS